MAARKSAKTLPLASVLGYSDIAERMGVDVKSVRIYAGRDEDFPTPVTPASWRSPGFSENDVDRYLELRKIRNSGRSGRPPRSIDSEVRIESGPEIGDQIRAIIAEKPDDVVGVGELARLTGLTPAALGFRLRGQTRWKLSELEAIATALGVPLERLRSLDSPGGSSSAVSQ